MVPQVGFHINWNIFIYLLQMQNKIDALEAQLSQAKTSNHNHTFADAERLTEVHNWSFSSIFFTSPAILIIISTN